jgi:hypothetical protein
LINANLKDGDISKAAFSYFLLARQVTSSDSFMEELSDSLIAGGPPLILRASKQDQSMQRQRLPNGEHQAFSLPWEGMFMALCQIIRASMSKSTDSSMPALMRGLYFVCGMGESPPCISV